MRVFVPINGNKKCYQLAKDNPERLGYIISPSYYLRPKDGVPFILDNDAFGCWKRGTEFDENAWNSMNRKVEHSGRIPEWAIVPDVVCDREGTLRNWERYEGIIHWPKAFVLQDGMTLGDVPKADVYFVGGSDHFKWGTAKHWCDNLPRVHIGRVRSRRLHYCDGIGAESCDGSGWLRETVNGRPFRQLEAWVLKCNHQYEIKFSTINP